MVAVLRPRRRGDDGDGGALVMSRQHLRGGLSPDPTEREMEALRLRAMGLSRQEAEMRMGITRWGFNSLAQSLYERLGVTSLVDALRAVGWLKPPKDKP